MEIIESQTQRKKIRIMWKLKTISENIITVGKLDI